MPEIRTMKIIVGLMTLAIVVMLGMVFYGISRNASEVGEKLVSVATWSKALPAGAQPVSISAAGSNLAVLADTPEGRKIYVFEPKTGDLRGTLSAARN